MFETSPLINPAVAQQLREDLARKLGLTVELIKPCVASIPPQPEGTRSKWAFVLAVELLRAGASPENTREYLASWVRLCEQPPAARHAFTARDLDSTIRSALSKQQSVGLRGYGCDGELQQYCPYGEARKTCCPYLARNRRPPQRDKITTLLGAWNLAKGHWIPAHWKPAVVLRRKFLLMGIGALEAAKGFPGGELITSVRELEHETKIARSTLRRDLPEMHKAGWVFYEPGLSRRELGEGPPRGARIRRLLPGESAEAEAAQRAEREAELLKLFPGSEVIRVDRASPFLRRPTPLPPGGGKTRTLR